MSDLLQMSRIKKKIFTHFTAINNTMTITLSLISRETGGLRKGFPENSHWVDVGDNNLTKMNTHT